MLESIIFMLLMLARARFPKEELEPLPGKDWMDCLQVEKSAHLIILNFHVKGDKSSKAVHCEI